MNIDASETLPVQDGAGISHAGQLLQLSEVSDDHATIVGAMRAVHGSAHDPPFPAMDSQTVPDVVKQEEESSLLSDPPLGATTGPAEPLEKDSSPDGDGNDVCEFWNSDNPYEFHGPYDHYSHPYTYQFQWMHGSRFHNLHQRCSYRECYQITPEFESPRRFIQSPPEPTGVVSFFLLCFLFSCWIYLLAFYLLLHAFCFILKAPHS